MPAGSLPGLVQCFAVAFELRRSLGLARLSVRRFHIQEMAMRLPQKTNLITGTAIGIGLGTAVRCLQEGSVWPWPMCSYFKTGPMTQMQANSKAAVDNFPMSIQVLIVGIHLARSTRGKPCAPPQSV